MAFSHGKDADVSLGTSGTPGTPSSISAYVTAVGMPRTADTAETSTLDKSSKTYVAGLKDGTITLEGKWDPAVDSHLNGILGLDGVAFEVYPQGNASGKVKYSGSGILTSYEVNDDIGDAGGWSAEFQVSGDVTRGTVP